MPPIRPSLLTPGLAACGLLAPALAGAPAGDWTQLPPLTAPVEALRQASAEVPAQPDAGIQDLLEETRIEIDSEGRRTTVYRYVFRVDQDGAVDDWRQVRATWSPWREARPEIRARVITPDGQVHTLDPKTIGEYSDASGEQDVYGDGRSLKAPLPQLQKGALAEVVITSKDDRPFSATGATGWCGLAQPFPVRRTVLSISAPAAAPLKAKVLGLPGALLQRSVDGGRVRLSLELGPQPASKRKPANLPADQATSAAVAYTTTPSWQAAAAEYAAIVDRQAADPAIAAWAAEAVKDLKDGAEREARIARILARLHQQVRYTGIEFGDRAITPAPPSEVLKRGYGDCKDKATLLVAALRASGIPAEVALLQTGPGADVDPEIPGLGQFNHAIVHVPGDHPLWIDATADLSPLGTAYLGDEGRYALIAAPGTRALARIPQAQAADNWESESREVWFGDEAPGRVKETTDAKGYFAAHYRSDYLDSDPKKVKETLEGYVKDAFKAEALGPFTYTAPRDLSTPFRLVLEARSAGTVQEDAEHASATLNVWSMFSDLLSELGGLPDAKDPKPR
ncbi:MAG TPA: DUF3857 and transglutaminase domain-containing protein, partial [Holophagaceae bacterium]|nr:DUF3857 and transglutaminase domain-containing protein [Holophagaceae bacterium]